MADRQTDAQELVMQYAVKLGLHGVIIMSPECSHCGVCHDWSLLSDLAEGETEKLLETYSGITREVTALVIPKDNSKVN